MHLMHLISVKMQDMCCTQSIFNYYFAYFREMMMLISLDVYRHHDSNKNGMM